MAFTQSGTLTNDFEPLDMSTEWKATDENVFEGYDSKSQTDLDRHPCRPVFGSNSELRALGTWGRRRASEVRGRLRGGVTKVMNADRFDLA
jgi:catalase-peroxidase